MEPIKLSTTDRRIIVVPVDDSSHSEYALAWAIANICSKERDTVQARGVERSTTAPLVGPTAAHRFACGSA